MSKSGILKTARKFFFNSDKGNVLFLLLISCIIFLLNLNGWELWNPDEPRYAQVAREMRDTGEWILPHLNSEIYPDKPPLFFWLIAFFSFFTGGVTEVSARLPSALAAVGCIFLTYFIGKRLFDARAGFIATLVLLTSVEFFWLGRRANIDMTLTLFILLTLTFFYLGLEEKKRSRSFYLTPFLFMGLGVLTKGPVGFILPSLIIFSYLAVTRNLKHLKKLEIPWGMLLFAGIVLAWLIPACIRGGEAYTNEILFTQNVDRFFDAWNHERPFYYYLYTFPEGFIPWVILLPGAFLWGFSKENQEDRPKFNFPLCWFLTIFIFFSLSTSKRNLYLLPLYPAASILIGNFLSCFAFQTDRNKFPFKSLILPFYFLGGAFIAGGLAFFIFPFIKTPLSGMLRFFPHMLILAIIFIIGGGWLIFKTRKRQLLASFGTVTVIMALISLVAIKVVLPKINYFKSAKPLSQSIIQHLPEGKEIVAYRVKTASFNFYTGLNEIKVIPSIEELIKHLNSHSVGLLLLKEKTFNRLQEKLLLLADFHIVDKAKIGHRSFLLLSKG
jgi:4-amino-4-deoxy-L-arabinose transferase-like glycosyltransferase